MFSKKLNKKYTPFSRSADSNPVRWPGGISEKKTIFNTITSTVTILHYVQPNILLMAHLATPLLIEDIEVDPEQHEVPQPKGYEQRKSAHQPVHELFLYKRIKGEKKNRASKELSLG
jgi:hypothetical protein